MIYCYIISFVILCIFWTKFFLEDLEFTRNNFKNINFIGIFNFLYVSLIVNIDTKINDPESSFFNRSKSKAAWRNRVKEAYNNLVNNGFDIPVWKDNKLFFEQKMD